MDGSTLVKHLSAPLVVSPSASCSCGDSERQQDTVGNPYPEPRLRNKKHDGEKHAHADPTNNGRPDHESLLSRPVRVLDAEVSANQPARNSNERTNYAANKSSVHRHEICLPRHERLEHYKSSVAWNASNFPSSMGGRSLAVAGKHRLNRSQSIFFEMIVRVDEGEL